MSEEMTIQTEHPQEPLVPVAIPYRISLRLLAVSRQSQAGTQRGVYFASEKRELRSCAKQGCVASPAFPSHDVHFKRQSLPGLGRGIRGVQVQRQQRIDVFVAWL